MGMVVRVCGWSACLELQWRIESVGLPSVIGQLEDCIGICRLLISDQAEMITGGSIKIDGGWTAL